MIVTENYIKVTPKGGKRPAVVLAANTAFYKKHGAKVEVPTVEEIVRAFPELKGTEQKSDQDKMAIMNKVTERQLNAKDEAIAKLKAELKAANETIAKLSQKPKGTKA